MIENFYVKVPYILWDIFKLNWVSLKWRTSELSHMLQQKSLDQRYNALLKHLYQHYNALFPIGDFLRTHRVGPLGLIGSLHLDLFKKLSPPYEPCPSFIGWWVASGQITVRVVKIPSHFRTRPGFASNTFKSNLRHFHFSATKVWLNLLN